MILVLITISTYACSGENDTASLEILRYLEEKGWSIIFDHECYRAAVFRGHLDVIKYLHKKGCQWDEHMCAIAVEYGHLDVLKYLRDNGCQWDRSSYMYAVISGRSDILEYLQDNGCPM